MMKDTIPDKGDRQTISIIDPHDSTRNGLSHSIRDHGDLDILWEASDAEAGLELVQKHPPDLLLMEIQLPGKDGLELIKDLHTIQSDIKILVHSQQSEEFYAERCIRAGALGYVSKNDSLESLNRAITRALHGDVAVSPNMTAKVLHSIGSNHKGRDDTHHLHDLTDRELEIMILMGKGHTCHDSAEKLHISPRTVQVHRNNIRLKIGLENSLQLHAYAVRFYGDNG
jgi:DNA-binding NarL/FixJ family response regulator